MEDERERHDADTATPSRSLRHQESRAASIAETHDAAFSEFYRTGMSPLVAFLRWQGVPLTEAVDIAQDTMIQVNQCWAAVDHPRAWCRRVASRMWARRIADITEAPIADVPESTPPLLAITNIAAWEQRHEVLAILDQLPPRQRQVLAWTHDGYTPAEIAEELQMTPEAVRASLHKARRALATHPRVTGGSQDE